jgi:hypothetical protein
MRTLVQREIKRGLNLDIGVRKGVNKGTCQDRQDWIHSGFYIIHHVMGRSIDGISIFRSDEAWALLDNHFHLLIRTGKQRISEGMRRLLTGYVVRFNMQGRYTVT